MASALDSGIFDIPDVPADERPHVFSAVAVVAFIQLVFAAVVAWFCNACN